MIKSEWSVIKEKWEVLQALNHEFSSRGNSEIFLKYNVYYYTQKYIDNVLIWLKNESIIEIDWPVTDWSWNYDSIGIKIINIDVFNKMYKDCKQEYIKIAKQQEMSSLGLDVKLIFNQRAGLLQWFNSDDELLGKLLINSKLGSAIICKLFGTKEITLKDGLIKVWPSKAITLSGLANFNTVSNKQINDAIDQLNKKLEKSNAPICIQRGDKSAFITVRDL